MTFFTTEYNIVILTVTLVWKISNYLLTFKKYDQKVREIVFIKINNIIKVLKILNTNYDFIYRNIMLSNCKEWLKPNDKLKRNLFEIIDQIDILIVEELKKY
jgi:hypothetical protein